MITVRKAMNTGIKFTVGGFKMFNFLKAVWLGFLLILNLLGIMILGENYPELKPVWVTMIATSFCLFLGVYNSFSNLFEVDRNCCNQEPKDYWPFFWLGLVVCWVVVELINKYTEYGCLS